MQPPLTPSRRDVVIALGSLLGLPLAVRAAPRADEFPTKSIRIVVPFTPGGGADLMARSVGKSMSLAFGQSVIVDNKPGGGGVIGMSDVVHQPADGYTLVLPSILAVTNPALMPDYPFDTLRDFAPLTVMGYIPHILVVRSDFPATSLPALVAQAKAKPGSMSYGSSGNGTSAHLAAAVLVQRAGIQVTHVPYRGAGPAVQDLLGGRIQFMFLDISVAQPLIKAGKLRAIAVAPAKRFEGLPDVPTVAEQGYPGYDMNGWYGLFARAGTPEPVLQKLYAEVARALDSAEIKEIFRANGIEPGGMPRAEFAALVRHDLGMWKQTVDDLHISLQ